MEPPEQYSNDLAGKAVFLLFSNTFLFKTNNLQSKKKKNVNAPENIWISLTECIIFVILIT
jgi:hypothetical protein